MTRTFRLLAPRTLAGRLFLLTLAAVLLATLAACGGSAPATAPTPTEATAAVAAEAPTPTVQVSATVPTAPTAATAPKPTLAGPQPEYGGTGRSVTNIATPDPWNILSGGSTWGRTFYNGLVELKFPYDHTKGPVHVPGLATEWSQDGAKWTLKLRQGVTWHDGELFNADDVVATFERALSRDALIVVRIALIRGIFTGGVKKVDDYTVVLDTGEANAAAFPWIANQQILMVPEHLIRGDRTATDPKLRWKFMNKDTTGTLGVGTGPFKMVKNQPEDETVGERNPNYWARDEQGNRLPYLDRLEYRVIPDKTRLTASFVAGVISTCCDTGLHLRKALDLCKSTRQPGCYASVVYPHGNFPWFLNVTSTPAFKDSKVVQAARYASDHQKSIDRAFGQGVGFIWMDRTRFPDTTLTIKEQYEVLPWTNPARRPEFEQKSKDLLTEAGFPNGMDLPYPIFGQCAAAGLDMFTRETDQFYQAGFRGFLECRQGVITRDELRAGRWSIGEQPPNIFIIDPGTMIFSQALLDSNPLGGFPFNYEGQAAVDKAFRAILREADQAKRNEGYHALERVLANDKLTIWPLGHTYTLRSVHGCVHNYSPGGVWESQYIALNFAWVTKECR